MILDLLTVTDRRAPVVLCTHEQKDVCGALVHQKVHYILPTQYPDGFPVFL
ncbi:MAG: hypothetical protein ACI9Y1_003271, partial [Lentisphaeria bacterium]